MGKALLKLKMEGKMQLTMLPDKKGGKKDDNPKSTQVGGNKSREI